MKFKILFSFQTNLNYIELVEDDYTGQGTTVEVNNVEQLITFAERCGGQVVIDVSSHIARKQFRIAQEQRRDANYDG